MGVLELIGAQATSGAHDADADACVFGTISGSSLGCRGLLLGRRSRGLQPEPELPDPCEVSNAS